MSKYTNCEKECKYYYYDRDKKECIFKGLCVVADLPVGAKNNE